MIVAALAPVVAAIALLAPLRVTLQAPGKTPKVNVRWWYTVHATRGGAPVAGRISEAIIDPLGNAHPVEFGTSTRKITNIAFRGRFHDFIEWPRESAGIPLTLRVVVRSGGSTRTILYQVVPHR